MLQRSYSRFTCTILLFICCSNLQVSKSQEMTCKEGFEKAEQAFFNAQFEVAEDALSVCAQANDSIPASEMYLLLGHIRFARQHYPEARSALFKLLDADDGYQLEKPLPPPFVRFFEETRDHYTQHLAVAERLRPVPLYDPLPTGFISQNWRWIGGGILVASGTAIVITQGDNRGKTNFPLPPAPPE